ncbi:hypothetical protein BH18ACT3_BH18ACT3_27810 [soil metagenome]
MMDDDLRRMLEQLDPMPSRVPVDAVGSVRARAVLEEIMTTPTNTRSAAPGERDMTPSAQVRRRRRGAILVGGAAAAAAVAIAGTVVVRNDDETSSRQSLAIADAGTTMSSCVPFDVNFLADMPVAFAGTVTEITSTTATLQVDHWYRTDSDETDLVDVALPAGNTSVALDGVELVTGQQYLVTATSGTVNGCGFSGPATPELETAFDAAFSG